MTAALAKLDRYTPDNEFAGTLEYGVDGILRLGDTPISQIEREYLMREYTMAARPESYATPMEHPCTTTEVAIIECRDYGYEPELMTMPYLHLLTSSQSYCDCSPLELPEFVMVPEAVINEYNVTMRQWDIKLKWHKCVPFGWDDLRRCYVYLKTALEQAEVKIADFDLRGAITRTPVDSPPFRPDPDFFPAFAELSGVVTPSYMPSMPGGVSPGLAPLKYSTYTTAPGYALGSAIGIDTPCVTYASEVLGPVGPPYRIGDIDIDTSYR